MNGGKLNTKISFFEYAKISDGAGGFIPAALPTLVLETICSVKQIRAARTAENLQEVINSVHEIELRQRAGFYPKSDYLVRWDGIDANMTSVTEDITKTKWTILVVSNLL